MPKAKDWNLNPTPAATPAAPASGGAASPSRRVALGTYVPEDVHWRLRELALRLSREQGQRVTVAEVVTAALGEYLAKHGA